jgi:predicted PurR-regulated permease PerM
LVLAVVTRRPHDWIAARLKNAAVAATASVAIVTVGVIGPAVFVAQVVSSHVLAVVPGLQNGAVEGVLRAFLDRSPRIYAALRYVVENLDLPRAAETSGRFIVSKLGGFLGGSIAALTQILIMLFVLFFLYRDWEKALSLVRSISPLEDTETDYLFHRLSDTIDATVLGRLLVAGAQGLVAGITFASLGLPGAWFLGGITAAFAMIPSFGAFIVWLPVAVYLVATHHWVRAAILVAVGSCIISTLDNFLYPILVGTRLRLHTVPIFLSILGGIWFFGLTGLLLGPIVFTLAESLLVIWRRKLIPETSATSGITA